MTEYYTTAISPKYEFEMDEDGNARLINDKEFVFADAKYDGFKKKYYVKILNDGRVFDPYSKQTYFPDKTDKLLYPNGDRYLEVGKNCFDYYLIYLRTRNKLYLNLAEREKV